MVNCVIVANAAILEYNRPTNSQNVQPVDNNRFHDETPSSRCLARAQLRCTEACFFVVCLFLRNGSCPIFSFVEETWDPGSRIKIQAIRQLAPQSLKHDNSSSNPLVPRKLYLYTLLRGSWGSGYVRLD